MVLSRERLPKLLGDESAAAALELYNYYLLVEEDQESAAKWEREWRRRRAEIERHKATIKHSPDQ